MKRKKLLKELVELNLNIAPDIEYITVDYEGVWGWYPKPILTDGAYDSCGTGDMAQLVAPSAFPYDKKPRLFSVDEYRKAQLRSTAKADKDKKRVKPSLNILQTAPDGSKYLYTYHKRAGNHVIKCDATDQCWTAQARGRSVCRLVTHDEFVAITLGGFNGEDDKHFDLDFSQIQELRMMLDIYNDQTDKCRFQYFKNGVGETDEGL